MARRKSAEELRAQATEMLKQAKELEGFENAKIGAYIREVATKGFKISYDELQKTICELILKNSLSTINPQRKPLQCKSNKATEQKLSTEVK